MKNFRRLCFALVLAAVFTTPVFADGGETQTPPGDGHGPGISANEPGDGHGPGISAVEPGDGHSPGLAVLGDISTPGFANTLLDLWGLF